MKTKIKIALLAVSILLTSIASSNAQALPKATITVTKKGTLSVYTLVSPNDMFANTTHVIELPTQLFVVDGQFFAQYGAEVKSLTDSLKKPVTRFYISHDHPDHYIGFGDAFPNVNVYALKETKEEIEKNGQQTLKERQQKLGSLIASKLNYPKFEVKEGTEVIEGTTFIFEKITDAESSVALIIKLPESGIYIAQDVVYNDTHLFVAGPTEGWRNAMKSVLSSKGYDTILGGHGKPTNKEGIKKGLVYLDKVDQILKESKTAAEYKTRILNAYPNYAGAGLIDIYLPYLYR